MSATRVVAGADPIRLNRYLSLCGVTSRRNALKMVQDGRVAVNGDVVREPSFKVLPGADAVAIDGRSVAPPVDWKILALHKPAGYLTTRSDAGGRPTIMDLLGDVGRSVYPIGRLDRDSEGLLLLTNHGDLAYSLLHPRYEVEKVYVVTLAKRPADAVLRKLARGVPIGPGEWARPVSVERGEVPETLRIVLTEGKKREVRRMIRAVRHHVVRLLRVSFAGISLGELEPGAHRPLDLDERRRLEEATGVDLQAPPWAGEARESAGGREREP